MVEPSLPLPEAENCLVPPTESDVVVGLKITWVRVMGVGGDEMVTTAVSALPLSVAMTR